MQDKHVSQALGEGCIQCMQLYIQSMYVKHESVNSGWRNYHCNGSCEMSSSHPVVCYSHIKLFNKSTIPTVMHHSVIVEIKIIVDFELTEKLYIHILWARVVTSQEGGTKCM